MHHILLESEAKLVRERQRKLNPTMKEVVMKEILNLLELEIIFPISDSEWVSPVHVVPKKTGITLVRNEKMSWCQCVSKMDGGCASTSGN